MIRGAELGAEVMLPHYPLLLVLSRLSSEAQGLLKWPIQLDCMLNEGTEKASGDTKIKLMTYAHFQTDYLVPPDSVVGTEPHVRLLKPCLAPSLLSSPS